MKAWTPEYVCGEMKHFETAYAHFSPLFGPYWDEERPLMRIHSIQRKNGHEIVNITTNAFLENMRHPKKDEYYYFSTNINKISKKLAAEIQPTEFLEVNPLSEKQNINFWIGMKGTSAHTHYDVFENFNVQVVGRKRWTLFPPNSTLYLYPFLHPSHAQAQVNIDEPNLKDFPETSKLSAIEVITEPGDVLYLPPMWFHKVDALEDSININSWSYSKNTHFLHEVNELKESHPITILKQQSFEPTERNVAMTIFIKNLIFLVEMDEDKTTFFQTLFRERYRTLIKDQELKSDSEFPDFCPTDTFSSRKQKKQILKTFETATNDITKILSHYPLNTKKVWLGNYIEYLIFATIGKPELVGAFMMNCFGLSI